jgi:hypothetical protein
MKRLLCLLLIGCLALSLLCGCTQAAAINDSAGYDADGTIVWKGAKVDIQGNGVSVDEDGDIVIEQGGVYVLSGTSEDAHLVVKAAESDDITLVLNGVSLENPDDDTLYVKSAGSATIILADGTENTVISGVAPVETADADADADEEEEDASGAAIRVKCALTITGDGSLDVYGYINNGIFSKDDMTIESGSISVYAANDSLKSKQNITIYGGLFHLTAEKDGVQADDSLTILDGDFTVTTGAGCAGATVKVSDSGMMGGGPSGDHNGSGEASGEASEEFSWDDISQTITEMFGEDVTEALQEALGEDFDGDLSQISMDDLKDIFSSASSEMASLMDSQSASGEMGGFNMGGSGEMGGGPGGGMPWDADDTSSASHKGLKAENAITILGGTFYLDTEDDAVHTNGDVTITGGTFTIASGDDGVHGDISLTINGGTIDIQSSYEGLEAPSILITDGYISIVASDDGMNANGGSGMFGGGPGGGPNMGGGFGGGSSNETSGSSSEMNSSSGEMGGFSMGNETDSDSSSPVLRITGGTVVVDAGGDGLDSNGDIYFEGGTIYVSGPSSDWDAPIDYGESGQWVITGGTIMAAGYSGMAESPDTEDDSQCSIYYQLDDYTEDGETAVLTDANGNVLVQYSFVHGYNVVIISSPDLEVGQTYTLTVGDQSYDIELTGTSYSNRSFGFGGGPGGGFGGGRGGDSSREMTSSQEPTETETN